MKRTSVTTVVSFLGAYVSASAIVTRSTDTPIADSFPRIIQAMKDNGVKRLIVLSTPSYWVKEKDVSTWTLSLFGLMPKLLVPQGVAEMVAIAEAVTSHATDLDWTIFRIPHLTDGQADIPVWAGYTGPNHKGGLNLSRRSLARWVLEEIQGREWIRGVPYLSNY
jgi:nucleoside-diphosphate-sugar epimerase